jgi:hypothetical protein
MTALAVESRINLADEFFRNLFPLCRSQSRAYFPAFNKARILKSFRRDVACNVSSHTHSFLQDLVSRLRRKKRNELRLYH